MNAYERAKKSASIARGRRIAEQRQRRGLSQAQLADLCGVYVHTVSKWETGRTAPKRCLLMLANALDVDPLWLESGGLLELSKAPNMTDALRARQAAEIFFQAVIVKTPHGKYVVRENADVLLNDLFEKHHVGLHVVRKKRKGKSRGG